MNGFGVVSGSFGGLVALVVEAIEEGDEQF